MRTIVDGFGKVLSLAIRMTAALGALAILALALIGTSDVLSTRILNQSIPGIIKLSEAGLMLALFLGLALAGRNRGHIQIDILVTRLGPRARRFCDATGPLFTAVFFAVWTWQMWYMTAKSWSIREIATGLLPYPLYPIKFILFLGLLIATLESVRHLVLSVHEIYNPNSRKQKG
jgi:TRAP-type C4-dicarboxylate transport system permease small subunit